MKPPRITFAAALLAAVSTAALARSPQPDDGGVPPGGGVKADDYAPAEDDGLGNVVRPDGQLLTAAQRAQLAAMIQRLRGTMRQGRDEPEELYDRRVFDLAYRSLIPTWSRSVTGPAPGAAPTGTARNREGIVYLSPQEQREREKARQAENEERMIAERTAPGRDSFVQTYRSGWSAQTPLTAQADEMRRQRGLWCANNPEPCARAERRAAAQEQAAQAEQARREQWQVMHIRERICQPLPEWAAGVTTPQQLLAAIRRTDPDADFQGDGPARPLVTIETSKGNVNLALNFGVCQTGFRMLGR